MRPRGLKQIAFVRAEARALWNTKHLAFCACCRDDLALIGTDPLSRTSADLLDRVRVRCAEPARKREEE